MQVVRLFVLLTVQGNCFIINHFFFVFVFFLGGGRGGKYPYGHIFFPFEMDKI